MNHFSKYTTAVAVMILLLVIGILALFLSWPRPGVALLLKTLNIGKQPSATLLLTNSTHKTYSVPYYIVDGEGTPVYLVRVQTNGIWSAVVSVEKLRRSHVLYTTMVSIEPSRSLTIDIPIDSLPRRIGFDLSEDIYEVTAFQARILQFEHWVRSALHLPPRTVTTVWCPVVIKMDEGNP